MTRKQPPARRAASRAHSRTARSSRRAHAGQSAAHQKHQGKEAMTAYFVCATSAVRAKYGSAAAGIVADVAALGSVIDVSGQSPEQI